MKTVNINIDTIGKVLAIKGRAMNIVGFSGNRFSNGFKAITNLLEISGINYEVKWSSEDVSKMAGIIIEGIWFDF